MTSPGYEARNWVRQAVTGMTGGAGAPSSRDPLATLRALTSLRAALDQAERDAARRAREDGKSWGEIGEALGLDGGEAAFRHAASDLGNGLSFAWDCPSCGRLVIDRGPESGGPADAERGHAEGCERFAATVAAWEESWRDE